MIIKSLSRKSASYGQLVKYMQNESIPEYRIFHNMHRSDENQRIINEFEEMSTSLPKRKNGNMLYHEILSLKRQEHIDLEAQKNALFAMAHQYLEQRAPGQLGYGCMHIEEEHLHIHLMLSPNRLDRPEKRVRLTKAQLWEIQGQMEMWLQQQWPQLEERSLYSQKLPLAYKQGEQIYQLEQRTQKPSAKSLLRDQLQAMLEQSKTEQGFQRTLEKASMEIELRGKTPVVIAKGRRYRLRTLGLLPAYQRLQVLDKLAAHLSEPKPVEQRNPDAAQSKPQDLLTPLSQEASLSLTEKLRQTLAQERREDLPVAEPAPTPRPKEHSDSVSQRSRSRREREDTEPREGRQASSTIKPQAQGRSSQRDDTEKKIQIARSATQTPEQQQKEDRLERLHQARNKEHHPEQMRHSNRQEEAPRHEQNNRHSTYSKPPAKDTPAVNQRLQRLQQTRQKRKQQGREGGWERG